MYWVMNDNGVVIARSTVIPVKPEDYDEDECKARMKDLDLTIHNSIGDYCNAINENQTQVPVLDEDDIEEQLLYYFEMTPDELSNGEDKAKGDPNRPDSDGAGNDVE